MDVLAALRVALQLGEECLLVANRNTFIIFFLSVFVCLMLLKQQLYCEFIQIKTKENISIIMFRLI